MIALQMYTLREFMKTPAALAETLRGRARNGI